MSPTAPSFLHYSLQLVRPFAHFLALLFILVLVEAWMQASALPRALEYLVDSAHLGSYTSWYTILATPILILLLWQLAIELAARGQDFLTQIKILPTLHTKIIKKGTDRLLQHDYSFYKNTAQGSLPEKLFRLSDSFQELLQIVFVRVPFFFFSFIFAIYTLWQIHPTLGYLMGGFLIMICITLFLYTGRTYLSIDRSHRRSQVSAYLGDLFSHILLVKLFTAHKQARQPIVHALNKECKAEKAVQRSQFSFSFFLGISYLFLQGFSFYFLLTYVDPEVLDTGIFVRTIYINEVITALVWNELPEIQPWMEKQGYALEAFQYIYSDNDPTLHRGEPLTVQRGEIVFDNLSFAFEDQKEPIFKNLSFTIAAGEHIGIVGRAGSGKSSLTKLLLRFYHPQKGKIFIDQQDISSVDSEILRKQIAVISQHTPIMAQSIYENIRYGNPEAEAKAIETAAQKAGAHDFIMQAPHRYHTMIGEGGMRLSGGQQQLIALARIFLKDTKILLIDEPTAHLDAFSEKKTQESLTPLMAGKTVLVIAHRLSTLMQMDRILVFHGGNVVEQGTHTELLATRGLYAQLWYSQSSALLSPTRV